MARISVVIPVHKEMQHFDYFFKRVTDSVYAQSFKDFELIITAEGKMAHNTNAGIKLSTGELIKILYMDDYLSHENALQEISDAFEEKDQWLATGCLHQRYEPENYEDPHSPHYPSYNEKIYTGANTIGSPSVLTIRNEGHLLFDENLSFLLDCDLYSRYYKTYGAPKLLNDLNVVIGIHQGQTSNIMPEKDKLLEFEYMNKKNA